MPSGRGRAARAQSAGKFQEEIVPVSTKVLDEGGAEHQITVSKDEGVRPSTTLEGLAKLRPAFKPDGSTTAGESATVIMITRLIYRRLSQMQ